MRREVVGRPVWIPTQQTFERAEHLASRGLTYEQIAAALGISEPLLYNKKKEYKELQRAIDRGRANGVGEIANALFESAVNGNVTAQTFYLKTKGDFKEVIHNEHTVVTHEDRLKQLEQGTGTGRTFDADKSE